MRWLIVGADGMLGRDLCTMVRDLGIPVDGVDKDTCDITDLDACLETVMGDDVVVNCAAFTAVDAAEEAEDLAFAVNALGAANLARAAHRVGARLVQMSTDYVFDGAATRPYAEDAPLSPQCVYGRTKAAGEWAARAECRAHLVVRTGWLYGAQGACFPRTIARLAREHGGVDVVDDQVGQPTWTVDLADLVIRLVTSGAPSGTYHGTSSGQTSWHEFAQAVIASAGMDPAIVRPTTSAAFIRPARRPQYSVLGHAAFADVEVEPIGDWAARWQAAAGEVLA
jgi:dTDP-4-dehydrorhamnose reductase